MADIELSEEELALLELDGAEPNVLDELPPITAPAKRRRKAPAAERDAASFEPTPIVEPEPILVTPPTPLVAPPALIEPEPLPVKPPMKLRRNPDHPLAPPAQHDYGDPWGLLPVQMRPKDF